MKKTKYVAILSAIGLLLCGCNNDKKSNDTNVSEITSSTETNNTDNIDSTNLLLKIAENSDMTKLLEEFKVVSIYDTYTFSDGENEETFEQNINFTIDEKTENIVYTIISANDTEYDDGIVDYWQSDDGEETTSIAIINLPGSCSSREYSRYIFKYDEDDTMKIESITENDDGTITFKCYDNFNESYNYEDEEISYSYKYDYTLITDNQYRLLSMENTTTNLDNPDDYTYFKMEISFDKNEFVVPEFMNHVNRLTVNILTDEDNCITQMYDIPKGFTPEFCPPDDDGNYIYAYDENGTEIIEDMSTIVAPNVIYAINSTKVTLG